MRTLPQVVLATLGCVAIAASAGAQSRHARSPIPPNPYLAPGEHVPPPRADLLRPPVQSAEGYYHSALPQNPKDAWIEYRVMARLGDLPRAFTGAVHVRSVRGALLLYGSVPDEGTHTRVLLAANGVEGVRVLRDELAVRPADARPVGGGPVDGTLLAASASVANDPGVVGQPLAIDAHGGVLTVSGHVATYADADRVMQRLKSIDGVRGVRSQLVVNEGTVIAVPQQR